MPQLCNLVFYYTEDKESKIKDYLKDKNSSTRDALLEFMKDVGFGTNLSTDEITFFAKSSVINSEKYLNNNLTWYHILGRKTQANIQVMRDKIFGGGMNEIIKIK